MKLQQSKVYTIHDNDDNKDTIKIEGWMKGVERDLVVVMEIQNAAMPSMQMCKVRCIIKWQSRRVLVQAIIDIIRTIKLIGCNLLSPIVLSS